MIRTGTINVLFAIIVVDVKWPIQHSPTPRFTAYNSGRGAIDVPAGDAVKKEKILKQNKVHYYFTTIFFVHILVYLFKIDNDGFTLHEYFNRPIQTCTEQPLLKNVLYSGNSISDTSQYSEYCDVKIDNSQIKIIWDSIVLLYNSRVLHLLKINESCSTQKLTLISVLNRHHIVRKSSADDDTEYRFYSINKYSNQ